MRSLLTLPLVCALAVLGPGAAGGAGDPQPAPSAHSTDPTDPRSQQTSDGVRGEIAAPVPGHLRGRFTRETVRTWAVAPGVEATVWDQADARGPVRLHLLAVKYDKPGLRLDYANAGPVRGTDRVKRILELTSSAVAGVNGDFFDIGDTGAPLGLGHDRQRGGLHARLSGWNSAFYLDGRGRPEIGTLPMLARVVQRPRLTITNVNSPEVRTGGVGLYTRSWGESAGYRVTGGQRQHVRMVRIHHGRVVRNRTTLPSGKRIEGQLLVGRGEGAQALRTLRPGQRASVRWRLDGSPQMAITGNKFLVRDGVVEVTDDRELHPRTAVGIDRETQQILMLVVDGRQKTSRGLTMVELAETMTGLGADDALNLDGGGSSTLVAEQDGELGLVNSPSDGAQRRVPNGIEISWRRPR